MLRTRPRDPADTARLALRNIEGNVCFTRHEAWAWFVLPTQPWAFRSDTQREQLLFGFGDALSWLAGHRLHLRVTSRPYPDRGVGPSTAPADAGSPRHARGGALDRAHGHDAEASAQPDHGREGSLPRSSGREPGSQPSLDRCRLAPSGQHRARPPAVTGRTGDGDGRPARARRSPCHGRRYGVAVATLRRPRSSRARRLVPGGRRRVDVGRPAQLRRPGRVRRGPPRPDGAGDGSRAKGSAWSGTCP